MDERYMQRCIDLALNGMGNVAPNPMVGSVIVHNGVIIGEGYHQKIGEAHAEVNAIKSVKDESLLRESTIYVNLEPCAHYGKTPPCSKLIVDKKIPKVVIGTIDPFSKVAGKGIEMLKAAGIDVKVGVLQESCRELNRRFFTFHEKKRPYIMLKWAQTRDGFIDKLRDVDSDAKAEWITNKVAKALVHKWRADEPAIMVGTVTALKDNPQLTIREWSGEDPLRIVLDRDLKLGKHLNLLDGKTPTVVFTNKQKESTPNLTYVTVDFADKLLDHVLNKLYEMSVLSVIVEGGEVLLNSFIAANLWDEAKVFTGDRVFGDGVKAPVISGKIISDDRLGNSKLVVYYR